MADVGPQTVFDVIGEDGITRVTREFYRQIPGDEILGPMYDKADLSEAERRLREFLIYRLGGPDRYIIERGNPKLRMRHGPFVINQAARDRWLKLMCVALDLGQLPSEVDAALRTFFADTATFLMNSA